MERAIQVLVALPGLLMGLQAFNWLVKPAAAAESLGMPLLDGIGRSTQVGDMTALFGSAAAMILVGAVRKSATWLAAAALVLGGAALFRTTAWLFHGADLAVQFIVVELLLTAVLCFGVFRYSGRGA